jgi:hypothetical protein
MAPRLLVRGHFHFAACRYAGYRYADNVIMLSVVKLSVAAPFLAKPLHKSYLTSHFLVFEGLF